MPSQTSHETDDERTRREYLAAVGVASTLALAGCSGGGGGDGGPSADDTSTDGSDDDTPTDDPGGGESGGDTATPTPTSEESTPTTTAGSAPGDCPPASLEYERREIPMTVGGSVASCEVPASGVEVLSRPGQLTIDFGPQLNVSSRSFPDRSVEDRVTELREQRDLATITDRYDLPLDVAVVASDPDREIPDVIRVLLPTSSGGTVGVAVSLVGERACASALRAIQEQVVTTAQVV